MLVLRRKVNQTIIINGNIRITVFEIDSGHGVKIGIDAPHDVKIVREEILKDNPRQEKSCLI